MGLFDDIKALSSVQKIKNGSAGEYLSIRQVVNMIINLQDAKKNLPDAQYKEVYALFTEFRKCKTKIPMNAQTYLYTCVKLIREFDKIAPYEKYSGGNEIETGFMMDAIRDVKGHPENIQELLIDLVDKYGSGIDAEEYIQYVLKNASWMPYNKVKMFMGILLANNLYGTDIAIKYFDDLVMSWISEANGKTSNNIFVVPFFCGLLAANGVIDDSEQERLRKKYSDLIFESEIPS